MPLRERSTSVESSSTPRDLTTSGRVLVAEDDHDVCHLYAAVLRRAGWQVDTAEDGLVALQQVQRTRYDAVLSDLAMPGLDGLQLLRAIRLCDPDVPVLFVTASPSLDTAAQAVESDAFRYLVKPVPFTALSNAVRDAVNSCRLARQQRKILEALGHLSSAERTQLEQDFEAALAQLWIAYQPIVRWSSRQVFAYEALVRSRHERLSQPAALLDAAERLQRVPELGRAIRTAVASSWSVPAGQSLLFVNVHAAELADEELVSPDAPLSRLASRVVLEITERASLDTVPNVAERLTTMRELGFQIAVDDLGAGYAGLTSVATLRPDVLKLDMSLIREIDRDPVRQRLVRSMIMLGGDLCQLTIAEGVETLAERDTLVDLGCDYFQGFYFATPSAPLPAVTW